MFQGANLADFNENKGRLSNLKQQNLKIASKMFNKRSLKRFKTNITDFRGNAQGSIDKISIFKSDHPEENFNCKSTSQKNLQNEFGSNKINDTNKNIKNNYSPLGIGKHARNISNQVEKIKNDNAILEYDVNPEDVIIEDDSHMKSCKIKRRRTMLLGENSQFIFNRRPKSTENSNFNLIKEQEYLYLKYSTNSIFLMLTALISIFTSIIEYEIEYNFDTTEFGNNAISESFILDFALWISFFSTLTLIALVFAQYFLYCEILTRNKGMNYHLWIIEPKNLIPFVFSVIIFLIHPNKAFSGITFEIYNPKYKVKTFYTLNSLFCAISMVRIWFFMNFYFISNDYHSVRIQRVCEINSVDTSVGFSMRANIKKRPLMVVVMLWIIILVTCSFALRVFERPLDTFNNFNISSYWNAIWLLSVTMTTVGYGDIYPNTIVGRLITIFVSFCGIISISLLVIAITNSLVFEGGEKDVYLILERIHLTEEKDILAARLVAKYIRLMKMLKSKNASLKIKEKLRDQLNMAMLRFKDKCNEINATYPPFSNLDGVLDSLNQINNCVEDINYKYIDLKKQFLETNNKDIEPSSSLDSSNLVI